MKSLEYPKVLLIAKRLTNVHHTCMKLTFITLMPIPSLQPKAADADSG